MKSQDILLLLKLVSLAGPEGSHMVEPEHDLNLNHHLERRGSSVANRVAGPMALSVNEPRAPWPPLAVDQYTVRSLAQATGISKSQVSLSLARCYEARLARLDHLTQLPQVNRRALCELLVHGVKYIFPAKLGARARGIPTAWAAPVLQGKILAGDTLPPVWPDADSSVVGFALEPIYKSVPQAVKQDSRLYAMLALLDSIRIGGARERGFAGDLLTKMLEGKADV